MYHYIIGFIVIILIIIYSFVPDTENIENIKIKQENNQKKRIYEYKNKVEPQNNICNENVCELKPMNENYKELYELYYYGIPNTYDIEGNYIPGVEPDANKAIYYLEQLIKSPEGTKLDILNLGKLYHQGMHKFEPDIDKAEDIFNNLIKDKQITDDIWQQSIEGLQNIHKIRVYKWLNIPLNNEINNALNTDDTEININLPDNITGDIIIDNETFNLNQILLDADNNQLNRQINNVRGSKKYNDLQNTHDSQVLSTIKVSLDKLMKDKINNTNDKNMDVCIHEINQYINKLPDSDKKKDAIKSLLEVKHNTNPLSHVGMSERDILSLVWNRIHNNEKFNEDTIENLKHNMFEELASMQEHGQTVCATGRMTRLIDTLNGVDEDVVIKPTYAINEEMMNKSSLIRDRLLNEEKDKDKLEAGTSSHQEEFDKKLKDTIISELKNDYVNSGILTLSKFNTEIKKWIDHI